MTVSQIREIFSCLLLPKPPPNSVIAAQVSRVLRRFQDQRWIRIAGREVELLDASALQRQARNIPHH